MARLRNLHWWTVEYGLIGTLENPKIYGAGLLSSIGESISCLKPSVAKIPYTVAAAEVSFDVTRPQPQLFVTPDFAHLSFVLEEFANQMAIRTGGTTGIELLIASKQLGTVIYNTGIQVSGVFTHVIKDKKGKPIYIQTKGPSALSYHEKELIGHGTYDHSGGFGSPIGKLQNINSPIEGMSPTDLEAYKIKEGKFAVLKFEGGIEVSGEVITGVRTISGHIILISFKNCTVKYHETILFKPEWGVYDMAVGSEIISAYAGASDHNSFELPKKKPDVQPEPNLKTAKRLELEKLYAEVRRMRESKERNEVRVIQILEKLEKDFPADWLLKKEIKELNTVFSKTSINV
jgi:phenylalanine-4-hydroxylase